MPESGGTTREPSTFRLLTLADASCGLWFLTLGFAWIGHHNQYVAIPSVKVSLLLCLLVPLYFMIPGSADRHGTAH